MNQKEINLKYKEMREGEKAYNKHNEVMTIICYHNKRNIDVEFEDGVVIKGRQYKDFKDGRIKNPYSPLVCNIGFIGEGVYRAKINKKNTEEYNHWSNMLKRVYSNNERYTEYNDCIVCEEWHNFQNFAKWYHDNKWSNDIIFHVDKDIILKNNKIYSPETSILVDTRLNNILNKHQNKRGKYPIGIYYKKQSNKFVAQCSVLHDFKNNVQKCIGYFNTVDEAFQAYKTFKENYIKQTADEYKEKYPNFPKKLYEAMYNYKVEIGD